MLCVCVKSWKGVRETVGFLDRVCWYAFKGGLFYSIVLGIDGSGGVRKEGEGEEGEVSQCGVWLCSVWAYVVRGKWVCEVVVVAGVNGSRER
jgi:hypothetical protein